MWILILIVLAVVIYFVMSQASSTNQSSKASSRTKASQVDYSSLQVDYSNLEVSLESSISTHYSYTRLRDLLAEGKWREADQETGKMMLNVGNATVERKIQSGEYKYATVDNHRVSCQSADYFPCTDLCTIDRLWLKYSNGRFGFSVQKRIISELGEDALSLMSLKKRGKGTDSQALKEKIELREEFIKRIGWYDPDNLGQYTKQYNDLTFATQAPYGHLPTAYYWEEGHGSFTKNEALNDSVLLNILYRLSICGIAL
ncbi:GUN4 domain-containing protein [Microcoleus sp. PH2017_05_CCC_O_A]|uniref:GUN4 domain-containing protein n=1 Tax=Microcoleus sp. PH2017_05_CCC_O_A TaxID=2798816 RepID=UPI001D1C8315|nr:GUN4 domain-containing protein [Microcoleus sp. PH2017_05_CCC_O_A]MCC3434251.1 GUN4 domain-containing protein [Microcoleus sp. PH2017_05_CCC_O_A]